MTYDAAELARLLEIASEAKTLDAQEIPYDHNCVYVLAFDPPTILSLLDALKKAQGENETMVSGMADLAERANTAIARAIAQRDSARALLEGIHGWLDISPADRARIEKELAK